MWVFGSGIRGIGVGGVVFCVLDGTFRLNVAGRGHSSVTNCWSCRSVMPLFILLVKSCLRAVWSLCSYFPLHSS